MDMVVVQRVSVVPRHVQAPAPFMQESLVVFVDVIECAEYHSRRMLSNGHRSVSLLS
jgi:hypothetical protein